MVLRDASASKKSKVGTTEENWQNLEMLSVLEEKYIIF